MGTQKLDQTVGPADSCVVICVNVHCVPVIILNGSISLLCVGLTDKFGKYTKKVSFYLCFLLLSVEVLQSYWKGLRKLHNKSVIMLFI